MGVAPAAHLFPDDDWTMDTQTQARPRTDRDRLEGDVGTDAHAAAVTPTTGQLFDALLVTAPVDRSDEGWAPPPAGWHDTAVVAFLRRQPVERRETLLAAAGAVLSVLVGLFGLAAFLVGVFWPFVLVLAALAALVLAPRPELSTLRAAPGATARWAREHAARGRALARRLRDRFPTGGSSASDPTG